MDTPTKQRLIGAAVLVALAVIFLPMLLKDPAPDSGVSDVPLDVPAEPAPTQTETRDLPLVTPPEDNGSVLDPVPNDRDRLPTVDTNEPGQRIQQPAEQPADASSATRMQPPSVAGGDYAVHFGAFATDAEAATVVRQLRQSQLPGYSERTTRDGRAAWRVRIGPYASRADAEIARLRAAHVRDDVGARVLVLDQETERSEVASTVGGSAASSVQKPTPSAQPVKPTEPTESAPGAPRTGFAVQVGAFSNAAEAGRLRERLRNGGFTVFTETVNGEKGPLTRVRVGPVLTRAEADQLRARLSTRAGITGIVRPHP